MLSKWKGKREPILGGLILLLLVLIAIRAPVFITPGSLDDVLTDTSVLIMMALAQMLVILTRGIDLSVASNLALTGMCVAMINQFNPEIPLAVILLISLLIGLVLGAINGGLIAFLKIPPIVMTLGTLSIYRGLIFLVSGGQWVSSHEMTQTYQSFPRERFLGMTNLLCLALFVVFIAWVFLNHTRPGRNLYGAGGDPLAARYVGLNLPWIQFQVYCISGVIAGLCGYLWTARFALASTPLATGFELQVIAACVIGGVSIAGGVGTVSGCVLGCLFLGIIGNALPVIHISPFWQMGISGFVILAAIIMNSREERRKGKIILRKTT